MYRRFLAFRESGTALRSRSGRSAWQPPHPPGPRNHARKPVRSAALRA